MKPKISAWLEEIRSEAWAMEPERLTAFARQVALLESDKIQLLAAYGSAPSQEPVRYERIGSTARIPISGYLMKRVSSWMRYLGMNATATTEIKAAVEEALEDDEVDQIVLHVDSPGGQAQGVHEVGETIRSARKQKAVSCVVDGLACSGAYWLASQADEITASPDSYVGSIGVYQVWTDYSKAAEREGVTVHVVRSGEHKGVGEPGTPITASHLEGLQTLVDGMAKLFVTAVARGRGMDRKEIKALATGQTWLAGDAAKLGLVDQVERVDKAFSRLAPDKETNVKRPKAAANDETEESVDTGEIAKKGAEAEKDRFKALKAAFPEDLAFATEQFEEGASVDEAKAAYADVLQERLAEANQARATALSDLEKERAKKTAPAPRAPAPVAPPVAGGGSPEAASGNGPDFLSISREYAKERNCSMTIAMKEVAARGRALQAANGRPIPTSSPVLRQVTPGLHDNWVESQPRVKKDKNAYTRVLGNTAGANQ